MPRFSANLGFLWADRALPDAIRAAGAAGFDAVECHWPYDVPSADLIEALGETGLPMLGLNTARGDVEAGEMGLSALPGRTADAHAAIDQALDYARAVDAQNIHVMAGMSEGQQARETFVENLRYASAKAGPHGITILIEPLNRFDAPGYFLSATDQAVSIIEEVSAPNLKLMFDCYHVQRMEGDLDRRLTTLLPIIGHIQFASAPDRGPPDHGEVNFRELFRHLDDLGYAAPLGAEYCVTGRTEDTLDWLKNWDRE